MTYAGYFNADSGAVQSVKLRFESDLDTQLQQVFALGSTLAGKLKPLFGTVQPVWLGQGQDDNVADRLDADEYRNFGPRSICARTFLGPMLVGLIGRENLDDCGVASDTRWGGVEVDLLAEPWRYGIREIGKARKRALALMAKTGIFGDYSLARKYKPGPRWIEIPELN